MPGIYKLFTAIVALIGNISLISTGEMALPFSVAGAGLLWGYYRAMKGYAQLPKGGVGILSLTTFIVFVFDAYTSGDVFLSVAQMTLIFQTLKSFDIKEPWDPLQVFFVSLLQLLMASELTNAISFGVVFLVFMVFIVISIVLGHFVKEGERVFRPFLKPVTMITLCTLILTVLFFISIPRLQRGLWGKSFLTGIKTTGFSEKVDFGSFGRVKRDETVVMRVIVRPDLDEPLYLRGMTFDYFDSAAWYDRIQERRRLYRTSRDFSPEVLEAPGKIQSEIYLEPIDSSVIFTVKKPYKIDSTGYFMRRDSAGSFYMKQKISKRFFYRLYSDDAFYRDDDHLQSYLQFPDDAQRVRRLAETVTAGSEAPRETAHRIRDYLLANYDYSLDTEEPTPGITAIEHFLFNSEQGYCEHFATAMTLMLRSTGIPSRLVTGFLSNRKNEFGDYYLIRQSDAHSWVEAFIIDHWEPFDPTPVLSLPVRMNLMLLLDNVNLNWYRYVVGFSNYDQIRMTNYLLSYRRSVFHMPTAHSGRFAAAVLLLIILYIAAKSIRKGRHRFKYSGVSAEYVRFRKRVSRYGGRVLPSSSSGDVLKEADRTGRFSPAKVKTFIDRYRFLRFSGRADRDILNDFYRVSKSLKKRR